jgi:hypothetical protein
MFESASGGCGRITVFVVQCRIDVITSYYSRRLLSLTWIISFAILISIGRDARAASTADICKGTWLLCGGAVKAELAKNSQDPKAVVELANLWATAYDKQYEWLRARHRLQQSTPDADKIFEAVKGKLDPVDIATDKIKDKAVDALVNKYFARLAPLVKFASGPIGEALTAFFNSSETATDYDELPNTTMVIMLSNDQHPSTRLRIHLVKAACVR